MNVELQDLGNLVVDNIEEILKHFKYDYTFYPDRIAMSCPIHDSGTPESLCLYITGQDIRGNWRCWTNECESEMVMDTVNKKQKERPRGRNIFGFIRGLLSVEREEHVEYSEAIRWCQNFLGIKSADKIIVTPVNREEHKFISTMRSFASPSHQIISKIPREKVVESLQIPAQYYLGRNYYKETLEKYDIGFCDKHGKEMSQRVVVPVYDIDYKYMIGCLGRTTKPQCEQCKMFHMPTESCPELKFDRIKAKKWKNSKGFHSGWSLYNSWFAKESIQQDGIAYLVEGPGDVWRMYEAGFPNTLGMFGVQLTDEQIKILNKLGVMTIVILTDNDGAGLAARDKITEKCEYLFNIRFIDLPANDVGDMSIEEIRSVL